MSLLVNVDPKAFGKHSNLIMQDNCPSEALCFAQILWRAWAYDQPAERFKSRRVADGNLHGTILQLLVSCRRMLLRSISNLETVRVVDINALRALAPPSLRLRSQVITAALAKQFAVTTSTISKIVRGETWKHVA